MAAVVDAMPVLPSLVGTGLAHFSGASGKKTKQAVFSSTFLNSRGTSTSCLLYLKPKRWTSGCPSTMNCPRTTAAACMACAGSSAWPLTGMMKDHATVMRNSAAHARQKWRTESFANALENDLAKREAAALAKENSALAKKDRALTKADPALAAAEGSLRKADESSAEAGAPLPAANELSAKADAAFSGTVSFIASLPALPCEIRACPGHAEVSRPAR